MLIDVKKCKKCGATFDGKLCKPCRNKYLRERYLGRKEIEAENRKKWVLENRDKKLAYQKKYREKNSETLIKKTIEYQKKNPDVLRRASKKYYEKNKDKLKETHKAWKENNKDYVLSYARDYAKLNPDVKRRSQAKRRAKQSGIDGTLSNGLIEKLLKLQNGLCPCCKKPLGDDYHLDHIMPISLGGKNEDSNMQLLRAKCNLQKHAKHPIDYMQSKGYLL